MNAYRVTWKTYPDNEMIVAAETDGKAKYEMVRQAKEVGLNVPFIHIEVSLAPHFARWAKAQSKQRGTTEMVALTELNRMRE